MSARRASCDLPINVLSSRMVCGSGAARLCRVIASPVLPAERIEKMSKEAWQAVILIPSLEPDDRLPAYVDRLLEGGFCHVVIVDDGSSQKTQPIFDDLASRQGVTVLHHDVNHGKGVALKTGYKWIEASLPEVSGVITADADGQHTVEDCVRLAKVLEEGEDALYLGSRDFDQPDVPPKSRKGNKITSAVFKALYGQYLPDTQTGLRAFRRKELGFMQEVKGERYEYEMNVLIACARRGLPMKAITIKTVYENNNEGTHFHPIRDSYRIYKVILGGFIKFMAASLASWVIDQGLTHLLFYQLLRLMGVPADFMAPISTTVARVVSAVCNFFMNKKLVFQSTKKTGSSGWRYALLALGIWAVSTGVTWGLERVGVALWLGKLIIDILLYFVSYRVQQNWVFSDKEDHA